MVKHVDFMININVSHKLYLWIWKTLLPTLAQKEYIYRNTSIKRPGHFLNFHTFRMGVYSKGRLKEGGVYYKILGDWQIVLRDTRERTVEKEITFYHAKTEV